MDKNLKSNGYFTFLVVTLGLTNILNENHTELNFLNFFSRNFGERNQLVHSAESRSEARSKRKRNIFSLLRCWFLYKKRQNDKLVSTEIVN